MPIGLNQHPLILLILGAEGSSSDLGKSTTVAELFGGGGMGKMSCEPSTISGNSNNSQNLVDFEAIIEEIDKELVDNIPTANTLVAEVIHKIKGKEVDKVSPELEQGFVEMLGESEVVGSKNVSASMQTELGSVGFSMG